MLKRFTMLGSLSMLLVLLAVPASADAPQDVATDYVAAVTETAAQNQSTTDDPGDGTVACAISPYDAVAGTFHGSGYGSHQMQVENVLLLAEDFASFQVECDSRDTEPFSATATYWFEARFGTNDWRQVSGPEFTCSASSVPGSIARPQVASFSVPGPDEDCEVRHIYDKDDPANNKPHRLAIVLTTTTGVEKPGWSLPWARLANCIGIPVCPN